MKLALDKRLKTSMKILQRVVMAPDLGRSEPAFFQADSSVATHTDNWLFEPMVTSSESLLDQRLIGHTCIFKRLKNIYSGAAVLE